MRNLIFLGRFCPFRLTRRRCWSITVEFLTFLLLRSWWRWMESSAFTLIFLRFFYWSFYSILLFVIVTFIILLFSFSLIFIFAFFIAFIFLLNFIVGILIERLQVNFFTIWFIIIYNVVSWVGMFSYNFAPPSCSFVFIILFLFLLWSFLIRH